MAAQVLRVWAAWGEDKTEVRLVVKRGQPPKEPAKEAAKEAVEDSSCVRLVSRSRCPLAQAKEVQTVTCPAPAPARDTAARKVVMGPVSAPACCMARR